MSGYTDPAWDEYLSSGEDPTGGELEEQTPAPRAPRPRKPQESKPGCGVYFTIILIIAFALGFIGTKVNEQKEAEQKKAQEEYAEYERAIRAEEQFRRDTAYDGWKRRKEIAEKALKAKADSIRRAQLDSCAREMKKKNIAAAKVATYDEGYRDGYECGHDDADCGEGYGYSWINEELARYYSSAYKRGFEAGYRAGFGAGREDFDYTHGI